MPPLETFFSPTSLALTIFVVTYVLISLETIHVPNLDRPSTALGGAILMVLCGVLTMDEAYAAIDLNTLALLLGMMVAIAGLEEAGFFEYASGWILHHGRTPRAMLTWLVFASGALSAAFVNDTVCLLFTPIVLAAVLRAKLNPVPYLIALVTSANIGSVMMLTGNPQNMLIGISSGLSYARFFFVMLPVGVVCLALDAALLIWIYRKDLPAEAELPREPLPAANWPEIRTVLAILALVLAAFLLPAERLVPGLSPGQKLPLFALVGGGLSILFGRCAPRAVLKQVDWGLLIFFSGLFIVFRGVEKVHLLDAMREIVTPWFGESVPSQVAVFSGLSVAGSNVVSNVPYVLVARHWVQADCGFLAPGLMWHVLALTSTFAGNLTIVGSVANIIVLEQSKEKAPIGFFQYLRAGLPITVVTTAVGVGLLCLLYWLGVAM